MARRLEEIITNANGLVKGIPVILAGTKVSYRLRKPVILYVAGLGVPLGAGRALSN
jgi:hypothetical protein